MKLGPVEQVRVLRQSSGQWAKGMGSDRGGQSVCTPPEERHTYRRQGHPTVAAWSRAGHRAENPDLIGSTHILNQEAEACATCEERSRKSANVNEHKHGLRTCTRDRS